jgi:apolipoprotein D and lipocalin family protein
MLFAPSTDAAKRQTPQRLPVLHGMTEGDPLHSNHAPPEPPMPKPRSTPMAFLSVALKLPVMLGLVPGDSLFDAPATVGKVDLQRYAGSWFEIARYPNNAQDRPGRRFVDVTATYTARPDGSIAVLNACRDAQGRKRSIRARARTTDSTGAKLRVTFFWPFSGDYWVIGLDPGYHWAVVCTPSRRCLWVLSRTPEMAPDDYTRAVVAATVQGFDPTRLVPTPQTEAAVAA